MAARKIKPEDFIEAENIVTTSLKRLGYFYIENHGYHSYFTLGASKAIALITNPTSLYVRTSADKIVINPTIDSVLQIEIKDARNPEYTNLALEAFPILIHTHLWFHFGINCLYCFCFNTLVRACWVQSLPFSRVIIPSRYRKAENNYWHPLLSQYLPQIPIEHKNTHGSGDPFVLIKSNSLDNLPLLEDILVFVK